jgi:hypothetical protein
MKSNIAIKKVDINLLDDLLKAFYIRNKCKPKYILMNTYTFYELKNSIKIEYYNTYAHLCKDRTYYEYEGIPISICQKLEDGEVELL